MNPDPALYAKYNGAQQYWAQKWLKDTPFLSGQYSRIVDVGCGTGEVTNMVLRRFSPAQGLVAFDKYEGMVQYASKHSPNPAIHYSQADITNSSTFPMEWTGAFDLLTSFIVLHWVLDQSVALTNVANLLKPNGEFFLILSIKAPPSFLKIGPAITASTKWNKYLKDYSPPWYHNPEWKKKNWWRENPEVDYKTICESAGLSVMSCRMQPVEYTFPDNDHCKGMIETVLPWIQPIPEDLRADFMNDVLSIFLETCPKSPEGLPKWEAGLLVVHGQKKGSVGSATSAEPEKIEL